MKERIARLILDYLQFWARIKLKRIKPQIVGITGSAGKSSIREAVALVLGSTYKIKHSIHGNSESGIPLDILNINIGNYSIFNWIKALILAPFSALSPLIENYSIYIAEMGIDSPFEPKNMDYHLKLLKPEVGIFSNVSLTHSMQFDPVVPANIDNREEKIIQAITNEKGKLLRSLGKEGLAIINPDNKYIEDYCQSIKSPITRIGYTENADIQILNVKSSLESFYCEYQLNHPEKIEEFYHLYKDNGVNSITPKIEPIKFSLNVKDVLLPSSYAYTFGFAIEAGIYFNISLKDCIKALEIYRPPTGRNSLIKGINNSIIIDSSYNANYETTKDAINLLNSINQNKERILLLGDIIELGEEAKVVHEKLAEFCLDKSDYIYLVGENMKKYFLPKLISLKFNRNRIKWFSDSREAGIFISKSLNSNSIILVKGSQNTIFLEEAIKEMMKDKDNAQNLLCRQDYFWIKKKNDYFKNS